MVVGPEIRKTAKRFVLAASFMLLLPGVAGAAGFGPAAAGFGPVERSFWEGWETPAALFARIWESWEGLTGVWTTGGSIDPNGEGPERPDSCAGSGCGPAIDPNA